MKNSNITVVFSNRAYNAIISESFAKDPIETGGLLLGYILDNEVWVVMEVIPPGRNSIFQPAYFEYDTDFVNYLANSVSVQYKDNLLLLGLWHRHPGSMDVFSSTDDGTNRTYASLNPKGSISGLVNIDPIFRLTMYHVSYPLRYTKVEIAVGDDIIPPDFFTLKHYPVNGLNPSLPVKLKNENREDEAVKNSLNKRLKFIGSIFNKDKKTENATVSDRESVPANNVWYEKNREKVEAEYNLLSEKYPNVLRREEDEYLIYSIQHDGWTIDMRYPQSYDGISGSKDFRVYINNPLFMQNNFDYQLPYIATDANGKIYLTVSEVLGSAQINGLNVMNLAVNWLNKFAALTNSQITIKEFII
ncbi:MAG: Mov34/MPN/PAD-1 family protein [Prevotellaceae bacterium]|jgi:hypothetical protein|nr:Mov34/MPN/PAD-1 family protein [Prevotellaceae bacterium]